MAVEGTVAVVRAAGAGATRAAVVAAEAAVMEAAASAVEGATVVEWGAERASVPRRSSRHNRSQMMKAPHKRRWLGRIGRS